MIEKKLCNTRFLTKKCYNFRLISFAHAHFVKFTTVILRNIFLIYFNCKYSRNKYISFYKLMNSIEI